ncbi:glutathione S-transferase N-terminal domain-containing protein [Salipaludibacillus sp. LMS25]|jgi:glutaredoxin|uniref:glutaredoxin domain-containing protein n=1 Tax=Salipaludibacillus sp. LMS25 TaxID=2924031 RepID=UPI0020D02BF9|nr:glutaredoxin domain-containing protein [Salipaludibacillus sp. LMS25]UTR15949.1 glutathione S-transferase N-terminal domain-containing protein [Salipaludibacillus sp. LMS25]
MLKVYQRETCPYCKPVRERLTELNVTYINVNLPKKRSERKELIEITGVPYIPALVDEDIVVAGKEESYENVLEYIEKKFANEKEY